MKPPLKLTLLLLFLVAVNLVQYNNSILLKGEIGLRDEKIGSLEERLDQTILTLDQTNETLEKTKNDILLIRNELDSKKEEISQLQEKLGETRELLDTANQITVSLNTTAIALNQSLAISNEAILKLNRTVQRSGFLVAVGGENLLGRVIPLKLEVRHGTGKILLDTNGTPVLRSTMDSMHNAVAAAKIVTNVGFEENDFYFRIDDPDAEAIEGQSAGAAMAILVIAAKTDKRINPRVIITGDINPDGTIGPIGSVREKALAARKEEFLILLVPKGQRIKVEGIEIIEVSNIRDAMGYMIE